jgi:hypothetical protein
MCATQQQEVFLASIAYLETRLISVPAKKQMLPTKYKRFTKTYCVKNIF